MCKNHIASLLREARLLIEGEAAKMAYYSSADIDCLKMINDGIFDKNHMANCDFCYSEWFLNEKIRAKVTRKNRCPFKKELENYLLSLPNEEYNRDRIFDHLKKCTKCQKKYKKIARHYEENISH